MEILRTEHLNFTYGNNTPFRTEAVKDVSVSFETGCITGIIGHTGSGKSTLISHFNGLLKPDSGKVYVDGKDIWSDSRKIRQTRFKVGLVFQFPEYQLFEETVRKDIAFGPKNLGMSKEETEQAVIDSLRIVGLDENVLDKSPFELSGGQRRKAAIAGVIAMKPRVLVLDEPVAGLDPKSRKELYDFLNVFLAWGDNAVIIVSHSMDDVAAMSQKIYVMDHGKIGMSGTPAEIFSQRKEIEAFGLTQPFTSKVLNFLNENGFPNNYGYCDIVSSAQYIASMKGQSFTKHA